MREENEQMQSTNNNFTKIGNHNKCCGLSSPGGNSTMYDCVGENKIIKVFNCPNPKFKEKRLQRFKYEIDILNYLKGNDDFLKIYDNGKLEDDTPWFCLEKANPLVSLSKGNPKIKYSIEERLGFCIEIVKSLKELHNRGIAHRDIKPNNILVREKNGIKKAIICDYGIAIMKNKDIDYDDFEVTGLNEKLGSNDFTPLELRQGLLKTHRAEDYYKSDIYSFVKTVWSIINGISTTFITGTNMYIPSNRLSACFPENPLICLEPIYEMIDKGINEFEPEKRPTEDECVNYINMVLRQITDSTYNVPTKYKYNYICRIFRVNSGNVFIDNDDKIIEFINNIRSFGTFDCEKYFVNAQLKLFDKKYFAVHNISFEGEKIILFKVKYILLFDDNKLLILTDVISDKDQKINELFIPGDKEILFKLKE